MLARSTDRKTRCPTVFAQGRRGDATAQCVIGYCYAAGQGVEQNWQEALKYYRAAAEQGHPNAQCELGEMALGEKALACVGLCVCVSTSPSSSPRSKHTRPGAGCPVASPAGVGETTMGWGGDRGRRVLCR
jgi:hypothetical protein